MDTDKVYQQTMDTLALLVSQHHCPDGTASIRSFCKAYKIGRANLTASLARKPGHDMSVGVFLRVCLALGILSDAGLTPGGQPTASLISLRQYLEIDNTTLTRALLEVSFS